MPAEYERCRDKLIEEGMNSKKAKRICAIRYYEKHGVTPREAKSSSNDFDEWEHAIFDAINLVSKSNKTQ